MPAGIDVRVLRVRHVARNAPPHAAFATIAGLGGERGWLFADWLWKLRGLLDDMMGGVGMHRSRRDPDEVRVGDIIDCWRVEAVEPGRHLRLIAEMKLPGRGWLEFRVTPAEGSGSGVEVAASFVPRSHTALAYWYAVYPLHLVLFSGLARAIMRRAASVGATIPTQFPVPEA